MSPLVLGTVLHELTKIFCDINHYSWVERLTLASKRFYENYGDQEYAIAYVRLMLLETEEFVLLTQTID